MIYLNRRPFLIRSAKDPFKNLKSYQGINKSRLEQMEQRLKEDVLAEKLKGNGLFLVHEERGESKLLPVWMAIETIQTTCEVFESLRENGYKVNYIRIPISPEQAPDDRYIDEYLKVIKSTKSDDSLVVNCGMGVGRTTFVLVVFLLIRGLQNIKMVKSLRSGRENVESPLVLEPIPKSYTCKQKFDASSVSEKGKTGSPSLLSTKLAMESPSTTRRDRSFSIEFSKLSLNEAKSQTKSLLRLVYLLEKALPESNKSVAEWV